MSSLPCRTEPRLTNAPEPSVDAFVRRHQAGLWRFLRLCGCRGAAAEDAAQEALVVAIRRGLVEAEPAVAASFLRQTARFVWLRDQRDERRRAAHQADAAERIWQQHLVDDDGAGWLEALDRCLEALPARSRTALARTYRDGLGRQELGAELGIGEHGVRTLLQRLRAALRDCIERRRRHEHDG